jgi:hypothetical protein
MVSHHIDGHHWTCSTEYRTRFRRTGGPATAREATSVRSAQEPDRYEIRVKGHLGDRWAAWFDGMTLTRRPTARPFSTDPSPTSRRCTACCARSATSAFRSCPSSPPLASETATVVDVPHPVDDD